MSISLPQETQTQKLKNLDEDLKGIAEQLIADKFGIKEEVVTERDDSFPGMATDAKCTCGPEYAIRCSIHDTTSDYTRGIEFGYGPDSPAWFDYQTRTRVQSIAVGRPSFQALLLCLNKLEMMNLPKGDRTLYASKRWLQELSREREFPIQFQSYSYTYGKDDTIGSIFGCKIKIHPEGLQAAIHVRY